MRTRYREIIPYRTKDGSEIRELMHPERHGNEAQSLAEATIHQGVATRLHRHDRTEELYHVIRGRGRMHLDQHSFVVGPGDTVLISPGVAHRIRNIGTGPLIILCACSPAYAHEDTIVLDEQDAGGQRP